LYVVSFSQSKDLAVPLPFGAAQEDIHALLIRWKDAQTLDTRNALVHTLEQRRNRAAHKHAHKSLIGRICKTLETCVLFMLQREVDQAAAFSALAAAA
jgi:hypothetical protein